MATNDQVLLEYLSQLSPQGLLGLMNANAGSPNDYTSGLLSSAGLGENAHRAAQTLYALWQQGDSPEMALQKMSDSLSSGEVNLSPEEQQKVVDLFTKDVTDWRKTAGQGSFDNLKAIGGERLGLLLPYAQAEAAKVETPFSTTNKYAEDLQSAMQKLAEMQTTEQSAKAKVKKQKDVPWYQRGIISAIPVVGDIARRLGPNMEEQMIAAGAGAKDVKKAQNQVNLVQDLIKQQQTRDAKMEAFKNAAVAKTLQDLGYSGSAPSDFDIQKLLLMRGLSG